MVQFRGRQNVVRYHANPAAASMALAILLVADEKELNIANVPLYGEKRLLKPLSDSSLGKGIGRSSLIARLVIHIRCTKAVTRRILRVF